MFGWTMRRIRKAKGISQERLSALTGIDRAQLSRIETGKVILPEEPGRQRIARALGMTEDALLIEAGIDPANVREDRGPPVVISPPTRRIEEYAPDDPMIATLELMAKLDRREQNAVFVLARTLVETKDLIIGAQPGSLRGGQERQRGAVYRAEEISDAPGAVSGNRGRSAVGAF